MQCDTSEQELGIIESNVGEKYRNTYMSHSQMLGKVEYGGGPIFKVVLEC